MYLRKHAYVGLLMLSMLLTCLSSRASSDRGQQENLDTALSEIANNSTLDWMTLPKIGADSAPRDTHGRTVTWHLADIAKTRGWLDRGAKAGDKDTSAWAILGEAIVKDDTATVRFLLERGVNVNLKDVNGTTVLMLAAASEAPGNVEMVLRLLDRGAQVNARQKNGGTALHYAAANPNGVAIVKLLLGYGADFRLTGVCEAWRLSFTPAKGSSPPAVRKSPLIYAIETGEAASVKLLLEQGARLPRVDTEGRSLFLLAADRGDVELLRLLLDRGPDLHERNTALLKVAQQGNTEAMRLLLDHGADLHYREFKDARDTTVLMNAVRSRKVGAVQLVLERGAEVNTKDSTGTTPLMQATLYKNAQIVKLLLEKGADVNLHDNRGDTALKIADRGLHIYHKYALNTTDAATVVELLQHAGAKE